MNSSTNVAARNATTAADTQRADPALVPPVDVIEDTTGITLYADMPGVPRERLAIQVDGDQLRIEGDLVLAVPQGMQSSHAEIQRSRYERHFTLSKELDVGRISAELTNGVLRLRIPKAEHAQPRKIAVQVG
jgi:HSP20 family protein